MKSKLSLFTIWLIVLLSGPVTVLKTVKGFDITQNIPLLINILQRVVGLLAFSLLFVQIILGAFMQKWIEKLGAWIFNFHIIQGAIVYALVLAHPFLFLVFNFKTRGVFDPFYVFTDFCLLCPRPFELYYSFGRIAFWFMSLAILAAILRSEVWWRKNWCKFHILNYFVFFLIVVHAWFTGTDIKIAPFSYIYWVLVSTVVFILFYKWVYPRLLKTSSSAR